MERETRGRRETEQVYRENRQQGTNRKIHNKKKARKGNAGFIIRTLLLIFLTTAIMFAGIFMYYVKHVLGPEIPIDADAISQKLTSSILYQDENGEWQELQKLYGTENRKLVNIEDLPDYVWQAVVAIEDQRFFKHNGVDWPRTAKAVLMVAFTGDSSFGGSTLTQQLIKNLTEDRQDTIKRKVLEIFRALELEKRYDDKYEILEMYLNTVYFGSSSYGIGAAAETYFGKDASELTLAEAACIVGITNNPSQYNPMNDNDGWSRDQNQKRQRTILDKMVELGYITEEEAEAAKAEELDFVGDRESSGNETTSTEGHVYSYIVDQIIADVLSGMQDELGYSYQTAQSLLFNGGYKIYATVDLSIQEKAEAVFEDLNNTPYISSATGRQMQAAITIIDPYTGEVKAMVGGVGEKTASRTQNLATVRRPCGSAIKPISTYAPAIENGTITVGSIVDDAPVRLLNDKPWPKNYDNTYSGLVTIQTALEQSMNTAAVRINEKLGVENSFLFMKEKLGFTTLVNDDLNSASLALGGLTRGVTTEQMAAAYSAFVNNGIYTTPRTYTRVEDNKGNVILENESESWAAMSESTAYYMTELLKGVVSNGNAGGAKLSNMPVAGKTGTTTDNYDRYFVGMTPYYVGAVWCGYEYNESIRTGGTNPAVSLWKKVMSQVHEGLGRKDFTARASDTVQVTLCLDSGLLATDACAADVRGSRCRTITVPAAYAPTETCNLHVESNGFCTEGNCPATDACPASSVIQGTLLNYQRETLAEEVVADSPYLISSVPEDGCPVHGNEALPPEEPEDEDPDEPGDVPEDNGE
ncbi:MAG: transglycosylase domain-containing protein [Oscillospiraceae bacterium]